jgi:type IV pilus assembly protein PilV
MTQPFRPPRFCKQHGVSLIEVLVTVVITSLGLLGLAGLQAQGLRASQGSLYRAQAAQFAIDMVDRMRADASQASVGAYNIALAARSSYSATATVASQNIAEWLLRVASLPSGQGKIEASNSDPNVTITVQWDDTRAGGSNAATFTLRAKLWNQ